MSSKTPALAATPAKISLMELHANLRRRLQAQRQLIAQQLDPPNSLVSGGYPRSTTMRLLTLQPALTASLLTGFASLLLGVRLFKSAATALTVIKMVRAVFNPRR